MPEPAVEAVIYGLPLVLMHVTKQKMTNVPHPMRGAVPVNQIGNLRAFPTAAFRDVVRANVDTLYTSAFLDLTREPMVLSVPDTQGRYYLLSLMDAWTNVFAAPGKRTTGTGAGHFAITGPGWQGTLPAGVVPLPSPTNLVWLLGRTQTNGPADCVAVHAVQDGYTLAPLSAFGTTYVPPEGTIDPSIDMKLAPIDRVRQLSGERFLSLLAELLIANPPPHADAPLLERLSTIGLVPGRAFDATTLDPAVRSAIEPCVRVALAQLRDGMSATGHAVNGWHIPPREIGAFGTQYLTRAVIALIAFGANLPEDAVYPTTFVDSEGQALDGAHRYVLHFDPDGAPPVHAFWSVTLYDPQSFLAANPIDRYAISSWMPLARNADGSIDLYVQRESPGADREANWLPTPIGEFNLTMRMYWPRRDPPSIIDGSWRPPGVRRVEG